MSESPKPPGRGALPGISSPGSPPTLPADLQKYATTKSSPLSIPSTSNSSDSSSSSRSSSPRAFGSGPVTFGLGASGERGTMAEAAASWSGLRSSPQGSILDPLMSPEPSPPLASAVAKRESERAASPAVSVASALVPHSDRPYPHYPGEILNANLQPLVRAKVRMQKMSFIRTAKRGEASYAELGQQYDEGMATCLANRVNPSDKPPPPVNLPEWMVEWGEKNGVSKGQLRVQRGLLDEQRALLAETLNAGFDDVQRAQQDAAKRQDVNFKQLREENKMASIQQGTALSQIKGSVGNVEENTGDILQRLDEWDVRWKQMEELSRLRHMLENEQRQADNDGSVSDITSANAPVSHGSNSVATTTVGVDGPIALPDGSVSNASLMAAIVVSNNGAGGGGDAVLPSEPGVSDPSATALGPSIAGSAQGDPPSEPTSMASATNNGAASGASRPTLISAPPATTPVPLADGSAAELAPPGIDNSIRSASNANAGTTEDAKASVGVEAVPARGDATASANVTGIDTNASMAMVPTSNSSVFLSKDTVDPPSQGPNRPNLTADSQSGRRSVTSPKASIGAARTTTSATTQSISTTIRTGVDGQKGIMRLDETAATVPENEKENRVVLPNSKSKSTARGLSTSTLTNNAISLDLDLHHVKAFDASFAISKATGEGLKLKLSRRTIDDLCERIEALQKGFPENHHDVASEIKKAQINAIRILEDGVFLSSKAAKKFGAFLVTKVTDVRLNPSQPILCKGWRELTETLVQQVHIVSQDADVCDKFQKLIAPPLHSLCQSYNSALKSSVGPIRTNAREAVRHLTSLLKYPVFSDVMVPICSGLLTGEDHILQESCAQLLLYAVALGSEASILKVENGRPGLWIAVGEKKIAKGLISKALIAGMCASKDFVRRDTRVAANRLFARKELAEIKSAVEDKLPANRLKALESSVDYCNGKWASEGKLWCKDNGYPSQS